MHLLRYFFSLTALVFNLKLVSNVLDIRVRFEFGRFVL